MDSFPENDKNEIGFTELAGSAPPPVPGNGSPPKINKEQLRYVVLDCLDAGKSREEIRQKLMAYGYSEIDADRFIEGVEREQRNTRAYDGEVRGNAGMHMVVGGIVCLLGVAATVGSFISAGQGGAYVVIAWGAILCGAFQFYRGLSQWNHW